MSDLLSLLHRGSNGIAAQNSGIAVASNNVANANTEGYSRQRVDLEALTAVTGGVRSGNAQRMEDLLLGGRIRVASGALQHSSAMATSLEDLQARLTTGQSMSDSLGEMFASFSEAAASPTDPIARQNVMINVGEFSQNIRRRTAEFTAMYEEFNASVRDRAKQVSELAEKLASTNLAIAKTNDPTARDARDKIAKELSGMVGGAARIDPDGQMRFVLDGGAVLVDGKHASQMVAGADPVTGATTLSVVDGNNKRDVTSTLRGGSVGAALEVRDGVLNKARTDLDQLAYDVATQANTVHRGFAGQDGVAGRDLFKQPTGVAGAAAAFEVNDEIADDPSKLALGAVGGGAGSNAGALAMFQLGTAKVASGGRTLAGSAMELVGAVGMKASTAKSDLTRDKLVSDHLAGLQDSLAGVDIQEELTNLTKFEHASSAMTKFVSTIDGLLGDLIDRL